MTASDHAPDDIAVARTAVEDEEETTDALVRAARRAHVDLDDEDPRLYDQIDAGALDALTAHHRSLDEDSEFVFVTSLWDRVFVITPDAVEVYP